jgi:hypothetical protein
VRGLPTIHALILGLATMLFGQTPKPPAKPRPEPKDYQFQIEAEHSWRDADLDLQPGDRVQVYGSMIACGGPAPGEKWNLPLPSAPAGTLLVKIHAEASPVLATPDVAKDAAVILVPIAL